jgi:hypothetical protein
MYMCVFSSSNDFLVMSVYVSVCGPISGDQLIESDIDGGQFHALDALPTGERVPNIHWAEGCVGTLILKVQTTNSSKMVVYVMLSLARLCMSNGVMMIMNDDLGKIWK